MDKQRKSNSRRKFIASSALTLGGFMIVPRHVLGKGFLAPSDQLTKAIIGVGGMGQNHAGYGNTPVIAICDVNKQNMANMAKKLGGVLS